MRRVMPLKKARSLTGPPARPVSRVRRPVAIAEPFRRQANSTRRSVVVEQDS